MSKKYNFLLYLFLCILITSCGFERATQDNRLIYFKNIDVSGKDYMSYQLKNNMLLFSKENESFIYDVEVDLKSSKFTKIKDKTGKITRYGVNITADVTLINTDDKEKYKASFSKDGDYDIDKNHSQTLQNEKTVKSNLIDQISEDIRNYINLYLSNK
jgi:hypothetical protein